MSLLSLQTRLQDHILGAPSDIADSVDGDADERLAIYHFAYRSRLSGVLRDLYAKTWAWLGDDAFARAVERYVETTPSGHASLDDYGAEFPDLIRQLWPEDEEAVELAWLDRAMRRVFDGPDAKAMDAAMLAALPGDIWNTAHIRFHPTLVVRPVETHVGALWSAMEAGTPVRPPRPEAPLSVRVWRKGLQPHFRMIDQFEGEAIMRLSEGLSFADLCEEIARAGGDAAVEQAAGLLGFWLQDELIVAIDA